ncbi:MAG: Cof-type HAD-IIB family hydrolase [Beijerinckiaceae bacterium]|nr:Cof-type HAD-IIB family hydrolase [Beijerinckiaceae bacterium]
MTSRQRIPAAKISALVSDVDGTLVDDHKELTARAKGVVARLRARGILFSMISSRPPRGLQRLIETLDVTEPVAGFNGGVVAGPDLVPVASHILSPEAARHAVSMLSARQVQIWVFSGQDWLVRHNDHSYLELERHTIGFPQTYVEQFGPALDSAAKIVGVSENFELLEQYEGELHEALGGQATIARSQPYYLDITHPLANKGIAVAAIATLLGVPLAEVAVIGDGANDVAMFERSGLSIAMGNASPEVRQAADFVTDTNRNEGFAAAIERFILNGIRSNADLGAA